MKKTTTIKLTTVAMLSALSIVLVYLVHFPLFPAVPFLEYDPADITILLVTLLYGWPTGLIMTGIVSVIQGLTVSAGSGFYGVLMHLIATGVLVLVVGLIAGKSGSWKRQAVALAVGALSMAAVMAGANLVITPFFMGVPAPVVANLLLPGIIPFNLIKAGLNALLAFVLFRSLQPALKRIVC